MKELDAFLARHPHHGCLPLPSSPLSPVLPGMPPQQLYERGSGIDGLFAEMTSHSMPPDTAAIILSQLHRDEVRCDAWAGSDAQRAGVYSGAHATRHGHARLPGTAQPGKTAAENVRHTYPQPIYTAQWVGSSALPYPSDADHAQRHRAAEHGVHVRAGTKRTADAMHDTLPSARTARTTTDYVPYHNAPAPPYAIRPAADVPFVEWQEGTWAGGALRARGEAMPEYAAWSGGPPQLGNARPAQIHYDESLRLPPIHTAGHTPAMHHPSPSPAPSQSPSTSSASTLHHPDQRMGQPHAPSQPPLHPDGVPKDQKLPGVATHPPGAARLSCAQVQRIPRTDDQEEAPPQDVRAKRRRTEEWVRSLGTP